jgi:hypothetical protein
MTSNCQGYFQQIKELEQRADELRKVAANLRRQPPSWALDPNSRPDAEWAAAFEKAFARMNSAEVQELIAKGLDLESSTNIPADQMLPIRQLLGQRDVQTVEDYMNLSQLLIGGQDIIDPAYRVQLNQVMGPEQVADMIQRAYADVLKPDGQLMQLAADVAPFTSMVHRMTRIRAAFEVFRGNYLARVYEMADALEGGGSITGEQRKGLLNAWKLAMAGEAHFDLARRRTGQTLRSLQDDPNIPANILDNQDLYLDSPRGDTPEGTVRDAVEEALLPTPEQVLSGNAHVAQVARAVAEAGTTPQQAAKKLRGLAAAAKVVGLDPKKRLKTDGDFHDYYLRLGNGLAKDSMLANTGSQMLNVGSGVSMAIYGPLRQSIENIGSVTAYGTKLTRSSAIEAMQLNWKAFGEALALTRVHAKALWSDAFDDGLVAYGGQLDAHRHTPISKDAAKVGRIREDTGLNAREVDEWRTLLMAQPPSPKTVGAAITEPYRRMHYAFAKGQAGLRLFLHEQFGIPVGYLKPGFRAMAAADNVAGYLFRALKVRNELYMKARFDPQLSLRGPEAMERWVDEQFAREFRGVSPTDREVRRFRQDNNLGPTVSDEEVFERILQQREEEGRAGLFSFEEAVDVPTRRVEYGLPDEESALGVAGREFSEEMRFQQRPDSNVIKGLQQARRSWWVDQQLPFVQAPLMGTLLDMELATGPLSAVFGVANWKNMTPKTRARAVATWTVSSLLLSSFIALDAIDGNRDDLIVGNGPPMGPEREAWLAKIRAMGRQPNTVMGVPVGGFPILNTLMMWRDLKDAFSRAGASKWDQMTSLMGVMQVLTGILLRTPGVGQFRTVMNMLQNTSMGGGQRLADFLAYQQGSYAIPFIGMVRQGARVASGGARWEGYGSGSPSPEERFMQMDEDYLEKVKDSLGSMVARVIGTTPPWMGYATKHTDWLGNPVRLPWGMQLVDALKDYGMPQLWPEADVKTYAQLDAMGMLEPPAELITRRLDGVAMSGELQAEYVATRSALKGSENPMADMLILGSLPKISLPVGFQGELDNGMKYGTTTNLGKTLEVPLGLVVADAVRGRTEAEAYRALFADPRWQALMANPETTANTRITDRTPSAVKRTPPAVITQAVKAYYSQQTRLQLKRSDSQAAQEWKARAEAMNNQETRNRNSTTQLTETIRALNGGAR